MEILYVFSAFLLGTLIYRQGLKDGQRGRILPFGGQKSVPDTSRQILKQIESYDGNAPKEKRGRDR